MNFSVIKFSGKKIREFLHAYTTKNWKDSSFEKIQTAAFLNQKGRVVAIAHLKVLNDTQADCYLPSESITLLLDHLNQYLKINRISYEIHHNPNIDFFNQNNTNICPLVPWLILEAQALYTAHDLSLDVLNIIDFDKGCYLGQEIAARMDSRVSSFKKRLALIAIEDLPADSIVLARENHKVLTVINIENFSQKASCQVWDNSRK